MKALRICRCCSLPSPHAARVRLHTALQKLDMSAPFNTFTSSSSSATATRQTNKRQQHNNRQPPAATASSPSSATQQLTAHYDYSALNLTDIGANLMDDMYNGIYHSTPKHQPDLHAVLTRATQHGLSTVIITAGTYDECKQACQLIRQYESATTDRPQQQRLQLYTTCGIHPTRTRHFAAMPPARLQRLFDEMAEYIAAHTAEVVAVGECGYDVDRLHFSTLDQQRTVFPFHIRLAQLTGLPLFLHDRGATSELLPLLTAAVPSVSGVVHSYTGGSEEMLQYVAHGFYIGVNGCSLKTTANLTTVAAIPANRLLLETDAPWCDVKSTHAGYQYVRSRWSEVKAEKADGSAAGGGGVLVKGRNEPCKLLCVAEVVASVRGVSVEELAVVVAENTERLFGLDKLRRQCQNGQDTAAVAAHAVS